MPWNELKPMDQRLLFIAEHLRRADSVSALCERYGISRKTGCFGASALRLGVVLGGRGLFAGVAASHFCPRRQKSTKKRVACAAGNPFLGVGPFPRR